jgi:serine/threonine-protein kinase
MIGTSVQRYDIEEELGQGGMSVVYRGRDSTLDRDVAIKVLHKHLAKKKENRERFRREAQAIARLQHDRIVDVYDYSREEDDKSFIVMEYVPGQTLRQFVEQHGHPPPEVAAMIGAVLADALAHAHDHGVIHRDLKPENVMVSDDGTLKLMDFGIAHVADAETMTQTGSLLGSPAHMAPEIIDGKEVNRSSDIFSLGTVLYWLATGEFPFKGDNAPHLLRQVLECDYDDPEAVEPHISRQLSRVICRCLSRQPEDRYGSVDELRQALEASVETVGSFDIDEELDDYFHDPDGYLEAFEDEIVDRLIELGRAAMQRDEIPAAIAHFNRVLSYDPSNQVVLEELEELEEPEISRAQIGLAAALAAVAVGTIVYVGTRSEPPVGAVVERARVELSAAVERAGDRQASRAVAEFARRQASTIRRTRSDVLARFSAAGRARSVVERSRLLSEVIAGEETEEVEAARPVAPDPPDDPPEPVESTGESSDEEPKAETAETFTYRFKILPLAATVYIDGERMSVPQVLSGVELTRGRHRIKVVSPGCHAYENEFRVDGPARSKITIALDWKDASVKVLSNRAAVVYLNGDKSQPYQVGANGRDARIPVSFGEADSDGASSRKQLTLEIRPRSDLQIVRQQTVTLRPGERTSVNVQFPSETR